MNVLARLSFAARLYLLSALVAASLLAMAGAAHFRLGEAVSAAEHTEKARVPQLGLIALLELKITRVSLQLRHAMLARNPAELEATLADVAKLRQQIETHQRDYENGLFTAAGKQRYAALPPALAEFWRQGEANLALIREGRRDEAFAYLVDHTIPARNGLLKVLADTLDYQQEALGKDIDNIAGQVHSTLRLLEGLVALIVAGLVLTSWRLTRQLRRRIGIAQDLAERVRQGDLAAVQPDARPGAPRDEVSPLLATLHGMQGALTQVVSEVRGNAESVASASQQIAQGNADLSSRTEQQAAALQQTAATMDELGTTVRHNADNAQQAKQLAHQAHEVAKRGSTVVGEVVGTMDRIEEASRRIADITSTIDGLAFQTNILALNAAVEAARAGEQGRGFAVVASEVRSLAQRSAEAAREIKSLIGSNVERVAAGSALVAQAGQTMTELQGAIQRVDDIVASISAASREQSAGVDQVGQAVSQMDRGTQQNAALVEESAAAAESLRRQAALLVDAVAVFKLQKQPA